MNSAGTAVRSSLPSAFAPAWWLPGGDLHTIWGIVLGRRYRVAYSRERWETGDGDFIDLDWLNSAPRNDTLVVLFHGLESGSRSSYALSLMATVQQTGWRGVVPHFRGCSGVMNRLPRSYHSGDSAEIDWILRRLRGQFPQSEIHAVGVSLGGNMLLKWLGETGPEAAKIVSRVVTVSVPFDLVAAGEVMDTGHRRMLYTSNFLSTLRPKVLSKILQHDLDIDPRAVSACRTLREIDDLYTAPVHGFRDALDYWSRSSCKPLLGKIRVPTLVISARNDPFLPASALPGHADVSNAVQLEYTESGGHVGFVSGPLPGTTDWLPRRIVDYLAGARDRLAPCAAESIALAN